VPWKTLLQSNVDAFKKALNKKIMFRYIINRPQDERLVEKFLSDYTLNEKSFVVRFIGKPPEVVMRIIDVKEAFISTIEGINPIEDKTPTLWSSNRCLIKMAQKYFDSMWESAEGQ
jgi:predicted RNA-binding protein